MSAPILFIGDSITDADRRLTPDGLGNGYVRLVADALRAADPREVLNRGVSGDRLIDLENRWTEDVIALGPAVLSVFVGINDTWRRYDSADPTSSADFAARYRLLLRSAVAAGVERLVLVEPFLLPVSSEQEAWREDLEPKQAIVADLASEFGARFVPLQAPLTAAARAGAPAIAGDGIHPSPTGTSLIAEAWLAAAGLGD